MLVSTLSQPLNLVAALQDPPSPCSSFPTLLKTPKPPFDELHHVRPKSYPSLRLEGSPDRARSQDRLPRRSAGRAFPSMARFTGAEGAGDGAQEEPFDVWEELVGAFPLQQEARDSGGASPLQGALTFLTLASTTYCSFLPHYRSSTLRSSTFASVARSKALDSKTSRSLFSSRTRGRSAPPTLLPLSLDLLVCGR
jgi:hypothetical protein